MGHLMGRDWQRADGWRRPAGVLTNPENLPGGLELVSKRADKRTGMCHRLIGSRVTKYKGIN